MEELLLLNAILRFHASGFQNLHWNSVGEDFDDTHKDITSNYYNLCNDSIDKTAEMLCRLGGCPLNFHEVSGYAYDLGWCDVDSSTFYNRKDAITKAQIMLEEILDSIANCLQSTDMQAAENSGIRSELESIQESFDIEGRYINKRRLVTL